MDRLIYTAMTGAKNAFLQQAGVAHNLANASTTGYRAMEHKFRAVPVVGESLPTRAFVVDASVANVFDQGPMLATGRPLDVALQGDGWMSVETPDGGRVLLTLHPAFVLRVPDPEARRRAHATLVEDLKMARREAGLA